MYPGPPSRPWDKPKVLANVSRLSRGRWQLSAAADFTGLAASQQFFGLWPHADAIALETLAAILNSPIANAYISERTSGQDLTNELLKELPLPAQLDDQAILRAVADYRSALEASDSGLPVDEAGSRPSSVASTSWCSTGTGSRTICARSCSITSPDSAAP